MSRIPVLVDQIARLKRKSQTTIAAESGIHRTNISKYLLGHSDVKTESFFKILDTLEIDLETFLESELEKLMGSKKKSESIGEAIETILRETDEISAKTFIETVSKRAKNSKNKHVASAVLVLNEHKSKLRSLRSV